MNDKFRIDLIAGLADNELSKDESELITNQIKNDPEIQIDFQIQISVKKFIRGKLNFIKTPERLTNKIIKKIK